MTKQDLFHKELNNFYALNKQINAYFNGSEIAFLPEKVQLGLVEYLKVVCESEDTIAAAMGQGSLNPTNTKDSIVAEITENLNQIIKQDLDDAIKSDGYRMSVNRLMNYHLANFENLRYAGIGESKISELVPVGQRLREVKKEILSVG